MSGVTSDIRAGGDRCLPAEIGHLEATTDGLCAAGGWGRYEHDDAA